jgi:hypothetical protein
LSAIEENTLSQLGRPKWVGARKLVIASRSAPTSWDNNVIHLVLLELGGQINVNLNPILRILLLDGMQEGVEPFGTPKVSDDPSEVDFGETGGFGIVQVVHSVPN